VQRYLAVQPRQLGLIADAWHRQSFVELANHAHTLAGEAIPLGATAICDYATQLARAARRRDEGAVERHWRELCAAAAAVRPALAQLDLLPP
jgi:HPt (histidine-containing phosphotransfer) domain-containing protein